MELNSMYLAALLIDDSTATASQPALSRDALSCNTTASSYSRFILWNAVAARWLMRAAGKTDCDATVTCLSTVLAAHCMIPSSPITPSTTAMTLVFIGPERVSRDCGGRPCIPCIGWHSFWSAPCPASDPAQAAAGSGWSRRPNSRVYGSRFTCNARSLAPAELLSPTAPARANVTRAFAPGDRDIGTKPGSVQHSRQLHSLTLYRKVGDPRRAKWLELASR